MKSRRQGSRGYSVPEGRGDRVEEVDLDGPEAAERDPLRGPAAAEPSAVPAGPARAGVRVHKAMAQAGVASRREAERMIELGQVKINSKEVVERGRVLQAGDILQVNGRTVEWEHLAAPELWALYKPKRCVSTLSDPQGRRTVKDFFPRTEQRLFPVGRLDYDAEGLLLLTSDGTLAQQVTHPSYGMPRVYLVKVKGVVQRETVQRLAQGIVLEGRMRQPARTRVLHTVNDKTWLEVVLREGIQHHIKKMFLAVGHPVLKIKRYQVGPIELGDLRPGKTRRLGRADIERLKHWAAQGRASQKNGAAPRGTAAAAGQDVEQIPLLKLPAAELAQL
jgi:23S rRNA pseudouridine2605 synthase